MIHELRKIINDKIPELLTLEKVSGDIYRSNCLKDKTHYMYIKGHTLSCPICKYSKDIVALSAEIVGVDEYEMIKRIFKKKFNSNIEIPISYDNEILKDANYDAMLFYQKNLRNSPDALNYLKERGITEESIEKFKIGYAPGYNKLLKTFEKDYSLKILEQAGLIGFALKTDKPYDVFRERIIFPIMDVTGNDVLGFGGRTIAGSTVKYINTKTTPLFEKSKELFGLDKVKDQSQILICEGYLDAIMLHQNGITNAVGTLGTALSPYHYEQLSKKFNDVLMIYDGDEPGVKAAERTLEKVGALDLLILPENMDPDDFIRKNGPKSFMMYMDDNRIDPISYWMNQYTPHKGNIFEFLEKHIKTSI